ncbi:MAG: transcription termination/antitermination factor NusG [Tissierellia bacterium]|nr:transcription termination/antitermination factor NusG [Tissierellia bacterium]
MNDIFEDRNNEREQDAKWYVVHTYSGHENKVKANIEKMVANRGMIDDIFEVKVPMEDYVDQKEGVERLKQRKMFPGYVLIKMIINDESWYLVRNTRGVTGFVGPGSKPIPLTPQEVEALGVKDKPYVHVDYEVGETVKVVEGAFKDLLARIEDLSADKQKLKAFISIFGRETLVELSYDQVTKI